MPNGCRNRFPRQPFSIILGIHRPAADAGGLTWAVTGSSHLICWPSSQVVPAAEDAAPVSRASSMVASMPALRSAIAQAGPGDRIWPMIVRSRPGHVLADMCQLRKAASDIGYVT